MAEAAISFSADAGPKLPKSRSPTPILASDWATARPLGSGLRAVALLCLGGESAGKTTTGLHHACGDNADQSRFQHYLGNLLKYNFGFVGDATQVVFPIYDERRYLHLDSLAPKSIHTKRH